MSKTLPQIVSFAQITATRMIIARTHLGTYHAPEDCYRKRNTTWGLSGSLLGRSYRTKPGKSLERPGTFGNRYKKEKFNKYGIVFVISGTSHSLSKHDFHKCEAEG
jgi:hypothetical protein